MKEQTKCRVYVFQLQETRGKCYRHLGTKEGKEEKAEKQQVRRADVERKKRKQSLKRCMLRNQRKRYEQMLVGERERKRQVE